MTKITQVFYQTKSGSFKGFLSFFVLMMLPMLFMPLVSMAQDKIWDPGNNSTLWPVRASSTTLNVVTDGLSEIAGGSAFGQVALNNSTWPDGYTSTQRVQFNGASAVTANKPTTRYFSFPVNGPVEVKVWWKIGGSGSRTLSISDGTTVLGSLNSSDTAAGLILTCYYTGGAGIIYIYSSLQANYLQKIEVSTRTTWNGTSWTLGAPTAANEAVITGIYSGPAFDAKKLTVNSGGSLTITSGTMTVQNEVINNAGANGIVFENNANLVQVNPVANTGNVVVKRNSSPLLLFDYTLWSSPVAGQNLAAFSPLTSLSPNRFYVYDSASDKYTNTVPVTLDPTTTNFTPGAGYLIRMPNTADAGTPTAYPGIFTGVPNNGDVPFILSTAGGGYNLVGNPYPSPINMTQFVNDNSATITGTLYFWRKTNGLGTAYCTWAPAVTPPTGTFVTNGNLQSVDPLGVLQTGQGFFVQANNSGSITFKNGQRAANTAGQFFKTKQPATSSRIWLNATNTAGDFSQMAVTYFDGASQGVDIYDGKYINDSTFALTSNINGGEYTIQGRPAFDAADVVSLNFKTDVSGNYTIAIDHADGLFASGQEVYLIDNKTGTETNLNTSAYTFIAAAGIDNTRFSLKYQKTLKVDAAAFNDNSVAVYKSNGTLYVNSALKAIDSIRVYDVQGRLIAEQNKVKANTATISNLKVNNQVLIVKVTGEDNSEVTKKVLN